MSTIKSRKSCALCLRDAILCDSHVIPEFVYKPLYSEKRRMVGLLATDDSLKRKYIQKGLREKLLCSKCEDLINTRYEQPSLSYWRKITAVNKHPHPTLSMSIVSGGDLGPSVKLLRFRGFNYTQFKLFLLSVLWRSSVSSLPEFWQVKLGRHEESLRKMLLASDPGCQGKYPVWLCLVTNVAHGGVAAPFKQKYNGHKTYQFQLGRIAALFTISKHIQSDPASSLALSESGCFGALCLRPREMWDLWKHINTAAKVYAKVGS